LDFLDQHLGRRFKNNHAAMGVAAHHQARLFGHHHTAATPRFFRGGKYSRRCKFDVSFTNIWTLFSPQ
jgi:hypothetical protein